MISEHVCLICKLLVPSDLQLQAETRCMLLLSKVSSQLFSEENKRSRNEQRRSIYVIIIPLNKRTNKRNTRLKVGFGSSVEGEPSPSG